MTIYKKIANYIKNNPDDNYCEIEFNDKIAIVEYNSYIKSESNHIMELNGFTQEFTERENGFEILEAYWFNEEKEFTTEEYKQLENLL